MGIPALLAGCQKPSFVLSYAPLRALDGLSAPDWVRGQSRGKEVNRHARL